MSLKRSFKNSAKDEENPDEIYERANVKVLEIPSPEDLMCEYNYAFTYSPSNEYDCFDGLSLKHQREFIKTHKSNFDNCFSCDIFVITEFSVKGRFHFHGFLKVHADKEHLFYLKDVRRLCAYGNMCMRKVDDSEKWLEYCRKNNKIMAQLNWPEIELYNRKQSNKLYLQMKEVARLKKKLVKQALDNKVITERSEESQDSTRECEGDEPCDISMSYGEEYDGYFEDVQVTLRVDEDEMSKVYEWLGVNTEDIDYKI